MIQRWRTFFGTATPGARKRKQNARGNALIGLLGGFLIAYITSEVVLGSFMHPLHWLAAGAVAVVLYFSSYLWLLRRSYVRQRLKQPRL